MNQRKEQEKNRKRKGKEKKALGGAENKRKKQTGAKASRAKNSKGPRTNESLLQLSYHLHAIDIDYFRFDRDNTLFLGYGSG